MASARQKREADQDAELPEWQKPLAASKDHGDFQGGAAGPGPSRPIYVVDFFVDPVAQAQTDFLLIDLDNGGGSYRHQADGLKLVLHDVSSHLIKSKAGDVWDAVVGVILRISGTDADIAFFQFGAIHNTDQSDFTTRNINDLYKLELDLAVLGGQLRNVAAGMVELADTTVNTATPIDDVSGTPVVPAVGDLILRVNRTGTGEALVHYAIWYRVE